MSESVPAELRDLVERSLAPGVHLERAGKSSDRDAWWFKLMWRERSFDLWIRDFWLHDQSLDLIAALAWIAAPAPEATLSGQRFWLRLKADEARGDNVRYQFVVLKGLDDEEISAVVKITGTARQLLQNIAGPAKRSTLEFEISSAIVVLKDHFNGLVPGAEISVDGNTVGGVTKRARPSDSAVRRYVGSKLYQAYQSSTSGLRLTFNRRDLDYLGVSEEDFGRATSLVELQGWEVHGLTIQPGKAFLQRFESDLAEGSSGVGARSGAEVSRRTVFICHAEADKTIAVQLKDYLEVADSPVEVFVASHPESLPGGYEWWDRIRDGLKGARVVLTLFSPRSKNRPWLYFESGGAHFRETLTIPLAVPPEGKEFPPPLGVLQGYSLDSQEDVGSLIKQLGTELGVRFSGSRDELFANLRSCISQLPAPPVSGPREADGKSEGWMGTLRALAGRGATVRVHPVVPNVFADCEFHIRQIEDVGIGLFKKDSNHLVEIPPYRVDGIHKAGDSYVLDIRGRIQWADEDDSWKYLPEDVDPRDPLGLARDVDMQSAEVQRLTEKLRAAGWDVAFQHEIKARSRLSPNHQPVYDSNGRYFRVPDRVAPSVLVKHRERR